MHHKWKGDDNKKEVQAVSFWSQHRVQYSGLSPNSTPKFTFIYQTTCPNFV